MFNKNKFPKSKAFKRAEKWQNEDSQEEDDSMDVDEGADLKDFEELLKELLEQVRKLNTTLTQMVLTHQQIPSL